MWRNSDTSYGVISKWLHWLIAVTVFGLFGLGLWMVELDYYDSWYRKGPDLHRSIGVLLIIATAVRLLWIVFNGKPTPIAGHRHWEVVLARCVHVLLYILVFAMGLTGYLISTADGRAVEVFNWFSLPSTGEWVVNQEDIAGEIHEWLAFALIAVAVLHGLAAIKHHCIDKDTTLTRMF